MNDFIDLIVSLSITKFYILIVLFDILWNHVRIRHVVILQRILLNNGWKCIGVIVFYLLPAYHQSVLVVVCAGILNYWCFLLVLQKHVLVSDYLGIGTFRLQLRIVVTVRMESCPCLKSYFSDRRVASLFKVMALSFILIPVERSTKFLRFVCLIEHTPLGSHFGQKMLLPTLVADVDLELFVVQRHLGWLYGSKHLNLLAFFLPPVPF